MSGILNPVLHGTGEILDLFLGSELMKHTWHVEVICQCPQ